MELSYFSLLWFSRWLSRSKDGCLHDFFFSGGHQRCSIRKIFLKISQYSQENTCARVSFLTKLQAWPATLLKKRLWHTCFHVKFAKFLITFYRTAPDDCFCYFEKSESYWLCEKFWFLTSHCKTMSKGKLQKQSSVGVL